MGDDAALHEAVETIRIQGVIARSILARDSGLWENLAACYHPDATLTTSWFTGTPAEFVRGCQDMKVARHEVESQKHMTSNYAIEIRGDRAIAECDMILYQRRLIDGVELDFSTWSRRLNAVARRDGEWKISRQTVIYEKDRMDPANPDAVPDGFYASMDLAPYPSQIRFHCWRNAMIGFPPPKSICLKGSEREEEVRAAARRWLAGDE